MRVQSVLSRYAPILLAILMLTGCATGSPDAADDSLHQQAAQEISIYSFDRHDYTQPDRVLAYIEQQTNTKLSMLTGAWDDSQFDVLINTGDYPDVLTIVDSDKYGRFNKWVTDGVLVPFDDELLEGLPHLQEVFQRPEYQSLRINGQFYGLPLQDEFPAGSPGQFVMTMRQDWLDALQLPIPQTLEQFHETLLAFRDQDPDADGQHNTYGIITHSLPELVKNLAGAWGIPVDKRSTGFLQKGNVYEYWVIQPEVKEALRYVRQLYADRLIDPDSISINTNVKLRPKFLEGKIGAMFDTLNYEELYKRNQQLGRMVPNAKIIDIPALQGPNEQWGYSVGSGFWGYTVITDKADNPKAAAALLDYLLSAEGKKLTLFGIPDVHYTDAASGELTLNLEARRQEVGFDDDFPGGPHELNWGLVQWSPMTEPDYVALRNLEEPGYSALVKENMDRVNRFLIEPAAYSVSTPKWISFSSNSELIYADYFNRIILGELDVDGGFEEFVQKWLDSGGAEAMREMSDAIRAAQ